MPHKIVDIRGKRFGLLTPIEYERRDGLIKWKCLCDCGNIVYKQYRQLHDAQKRGLVSSCGCLKVYRDGIPKTIVGETIDDITVLSYDKNSLLYICKKGNQELLCDAKELHQKKYNFLRRCERSAQLNDFVKRFNCADQKDYVCKKRRLYSVFSNMKKRCYDTNCFAYKDYGARGITICDEWLKSTSSFVHWALLNGYKNGLQIDRINNDDGYSPTNCRFVTRFVNANNKRNNLRIEYNGKTQTLKQWCRELGLPYRLTHKHIYSLGWSIERAFTWQSNNK